jgi:hypothetical protein
MGDLRALTGWDLDTALGKLHRFWWWVQKYAEDGDLRSATPAQVASGVGVDPAKGRWLMDALRRSRFVDREPYLRVHNWWKYAGPYLRSKYKRSPERWQRIRALYEPGYVTGQNDEVSGDATVTQPKIEGTAPQHLPNLPHLPTNQPNQPNLSQKVELDRAINRTATARSVGMGMYTEAELEDHRMPFGEKSGVKIIDLDSEYCSWLLTTWAGKAKLDAKTRAALQYRCDLKRGETATRRTT